MKNFAVFIILGLMLALIAFGLVPPVPPVPRVPSVLRVLSVPLVLTSSVNRPLTTVLTPTNVHELTAVDVEKSLDGIVPLQLDREDVAGAIVAVVKDGKQLFTKGYGYADV